MEETTEQETSTTQESVESPQETAPTDPIAELREELKAVKEAGQETVDPLASYGVDADPVVPAAQTATGEDDLKIQNERLQMEVESLKNRSELSKTLDRVKERYPNAWGDTVTKLIRKGAPSEQIESIANASHSDYMRGATETAAKLEAKLEQAIAAAGQTAQAEVQTAWGTPPTAAAISGAGTITPEQFQTELRTNPGMTDAQLEQLQARIKW